MTIQRFESQMMMTARPAESCDTPALCRNAFSREYDVWAAYQETIKAAERLECRTETKSEVRRLFAQVPGGFATTVLERELSSG